MASLLNAKRVRLLAKENGKKITTEAIDLLARMVSEVVVKAAQIHNGTSKEIDSTLLATVIGFKKE